METHNPGPMRRGPFGTGPMWIIGRCPPLPLVDSSKAVQIHTYCMLAYASIDLLGFQMAEYRAVQITILAPTAQHPLSGTAACQVAILLGDLAAAWSDTAFPTDQLAEEVRDLLETALTAVNNHHRAGIAARLLAEAPGRDRSRSPSREAEDAD